MINNPSPKKPRKRWQLVCGCCLGVFILGCIVVVAAGLLLPKLRPTARDIYSGAPDLAAGEDVSNMLVESGVEGATVLVIPIKGSSGQIAIITLDESRGFVGFSSGADNLQVVVKNIVEANSQGNYHIEQLSIDYRDTSGETSLSFAASMANAENYADGTISRQEFAGDVAFNLMDTLRYFGVDELLEEVLP